MKKILACTVAFALPLLAAVPAFAQAGTTTAAPVATATALPATASLSAADKAFITKAAQGGMAEVQMAQIAQQKSQADDVKQFAQHMIDDHTPNNEKLTKLAQAKGLTPPADPSAMQQKMISKLQTLDGVKFDKAYVGGQVKAHSAMLKAFEAEAKNGKDADLKAFAAETVPTIQQHLSTAQGLVKTGTKG